MAEELLLSIEKLLYKGDGLAHAEGSTVFVPFVLPGEQVRASVATRKKNLIHAKLEEVKQASVSRIKPRCPHFGVCGGCHYQHIEFAEQVRQKKEILRETLSRLGGVNWTGEIQEHTAEPFAYRNRAQWAFRDAMPRAFGYFLPESARILPIDECPVLSPGLAKAFGQLQELARANSLPPGILEVEAFVDSEDTKLALNVAFERFSKPAKDLTAMFKGALPGLESLLLLDQSKNRFELTGPGYLEQKAWEFSFRVSHLSFFQVNRFLIEDLTKTVLEAAEESQEAAAGATPTGKAATADIFSREELRTHVQNKAKQIAKAAQHCKKYQPELAAALENVSQTLGGMQVLLDGPGNIDLEDLERRLTIIDVKIHAAVLTHASEELMLKARREVDSQLAAYRRKMKAAQLGMVESQYLQKRLLDEYSLPRVSLYYFT